MKQAALTGAGRFAPSPTGPLHLGSLIAALGSYLLARTTGRRWFVRIDDLDRPRVVPGAADGMLFLLEQLGFEWDAVPVWQSQRSQRYAEVLESLKKRQLVYPCGCSRKEVMASAPHRGEEGPIYPGTCRKGVSQGHHQLAWRLKVDGPAVCFNDRLRGARCQNLAAEVGDFVLFRADGVFAYQLATVVDDFDAEVDQVVRGADLLNSTPRQIFLQRCLNYARPEYLHLPLVLGEDGEKISKRHGAVAVVAEQNATIMLLLAFKFLGLRPPAELVATSGPQLLAWALAAFEPSRFSAQDRTLADLYSPS